MNMSYFLFTLLEYKKGVYSKDTQKLLMFCSLLLQALKEELAHEREKAEKENRVREMLCVQ